ncbi:SGNH/GDSL hydrolase family protein [Marispirochaeta aestuarii]|uniref:SGNH/GDSL hydrolase family protein n=1 Tax=Marispirochaeta aestuarii TaxID=1963862 RepID=UPI0029C77DE7|nr:SGNH/GDSL hydrolase family protein [Marispirochaeta aestuarii]
MKKSKFIHLGITFIITFIIIFLFSDISPNKRNDPLKILFIGNSYTFNNELPILVKEMKKEKNLNLSIEIKAFTPGGAKLKDHLNSPFTLETIRNGNWDIIVIQGHSLEPLMNPIGFNDAATDLLKITKESGAIVYLFETWSRAKDNPIYNEAWSGRNPESMQKKLSMKYNEIAHNSNVTVIPIGSIWQKIMTENKEIELYSMDGSHPSQIGSYLTACIIYKYIFNEDPMKFNYIPSGVKESKAKILRQYATTFGSTTVKNDL